MADVADHELVRLAGGELADPRVVPALLARYERPASRRTVSYGLGVLASLVGAPDAASVPWQRLEREHVDFLRLRLSERFAPATTNLVLAVLRSLLEQIWSLELISRDTYDRLSSVRAVRGSRLPRGRAVTGNELLRLMEACDTPRDVAMLAILYGGGLRRAECVGLDVADYDEDLGELRVVRKGNKEAKVPLPATACEAIRRWLVVRGREPGPLLCPLTKARRPIARRMTTGNVAVRLSHLAEVAGVAHVSPHDLRRSYLSDLLERGADVFTVQQLAGHADPRTTQLYDRRPQESRRQAARLLTVPIPDETMPEPPGPDDSG